MRYLLILLISTLSFNWLAAQGCEQIDKFLKEGKILEANELINSSGGLDCFKAVGEVYLRMGRFDLARENFEKALNQASTGSEEEASSLNSLGIILWNKGDNQHAFEYITRALKIREKLYGEDHELTAASYNDLGLVYGATDPKKALSYYEQALHVYDRMLGKQSAKYAQAKINVGIIFRSLEEFNKAETSFEEALAIWQKIYPEGHPNEAFIYTNLGLTSYTLGVLSRAEEFFNKALATYQKHYGEKHPEVASTYNLLGNIRNQEGEFGKAIELYQKALIANSKEFNDMDFEKNPSVGDFFSANTLLNSLFYKAQAFEDSHFNVTLKLNDLKTSIQTLQSCDSLVDEIRRLQSNEADKLAFSSVATQVYETGVRVAYRMGEVAVRGREEYNEMAFYFNEKSKSGILLEAISESSAKHYASIPDEQLVEEATLKEEIAFFEQKLAEKPDEKQEEIFRDKLFELNNQYHSFIKSLEENYPQYFNLKYNTRIPKVTDIQETLDDVTALFSYFIDDRYKRLYVFEITNKKFSINSVPQTDKFDKYVSGLWNSIYYRNAKIYSEIAQDFADILMPSGIPSGIEHVVVIPVGRLGAVPFETLILDKVKSKESAMHQLPYLGKELAFSYEYAAALYYQEAILGSKVSSGNLALLCAPIEFDDLPDLPGTEQEIGKLQEILEKGQVTSNLYVKAEANEKNIKAIDLKQYKYIHFATHGVVDEANPELSRIFLSDDGGEEDGNLYSGELYNIELDAELVTLSACETGLGKISKGEGIIGLSRALLYAGARNIVVSLWTVSDASTAELMINFYDELSRSHDYALALRNAKRSLIQGEEYADPYFWAPFILIGH